MKQKTIRYNNHNYSIGADECSYAKRLIMQFWGFMKEGRVGDLTARCGRVMHLCAEHLLLAKSRQTGHHSARIFRVISLAS